MHILYLLVKYEALKHLLDELADWKDEGCAVILSGAINHRPDDGFIVLKWDGQDPDTFRKKLDHDPDIIDHIGVHVQSTEAITVLPAW